MTKLFSFLQSIAPQHLLSIFIGKIADSRIPWLKDFLIRQFIKIYKINLDEVSEKNLATYPTFNSFFIRHINMALRPITADGIASPVDGCIAQIGIAKQNQLLQAKDCYFDLEGLLSDKALATAFYDGAFATLYLAPHNYHRVHMPLAGKLIQTIYIPGKLFSVNRMTSECIPNLYSRNERLVCVFETEAGKMVVILVGAMIVGSIQTIWMDKPIRAKAITQQSFSENRRFEKGTELGFFQMGSTVILLFEKNEVNWSANLDADSSIKIGQFLGKISN